MNYVLGHSRTASQHATVDGWLIWNLGMATRQMPERPSTRAIPKFQNCILDVHVDRQGYMKQV